MKITAIYEATAAFDIEVPDGADAEEFAVDWLHEHFGEVADEIAEGMATGHYWAIDLKTTFVEERS